MLAVTDQLKIKYRENQMFITSCVDHYGEFKITSGPKHVHGDQYHADDFSITQWSFTQKSTNRYGFHPNETNTESFEKLSDTGCIHVVLMLGRTSSIMYWFSGRSRLYHTWKTWKSWWLWWSFLYIIELVFPPWLSYAQDTLGNKIDRHIGNILILTTWYLEFKYRNIEILPLYTYHKQRNY